MPTSLLLWLALAPGGPAGEGLEGRVGAVLKAQGFEQARWGLLVVEAKSGRVVYERAADELFRPASVTKLFSGAAALAELGADHRFRTPVRRRGEVDGEGTLRGDLILVAQGDLSLGGRTDKEGALLFEDNDHSYASPASKATLVPADPLAGLDHLAREVHAAGIRAIRGDVLVDDRLFDPAEATGSGPRRISPIVVNDNLVDVVVTPGEKPGEPAGVRIVPETAFVAFDAQVETAAEGTTKEVHVRSMGPRRFAVRGRIPAGSPPSVHAYEVEEPAAFARALLIERLRARGVRVGASPLGDNDAASLPPRDDVAKLPEVAEYTSPPFREYLKVLLKVSQNLHASTLPLLLAAKHDERTLGDGLRREGAALKALGLDVGTISFGGGAGGSSADLVTPRATVALLKAMAGRPDFGAFGAALPILGRDGTLAKAVARDSPARGHARAKTGTYYVANGLNGGAVLTSKALAGYLDAASGRTLIFAFFVNDVPLKVEGDVTDATAAVGRLLGRLCEVFYDDTPTESSKPATAEETKAGR